MVQTIRESELGPVRVPRERPIIFSAPMVRAILAGTKTQTRRVVTSKTALEWLAPDMFETRFVADPENELCPYGFAGDRLWVRETFYCDHCFVGDYERTTNSGRVGPRVEPDRAKCEAEWRDMIWYNADAPIETGYWSERTPPLKPSIYMPRWASRITLELTDVRVQRLRDISEDDARAEGFRPMSGATILEDIEGSYGDGRPHTARDAFGGLWDELNSKRPGCSWEANPWVWALTFLRVQP